MRVSLLQLGDRVQLRVCNDCPRLSQQEFERIGEAFYRRPGSTGQGAGLGLSIVALVAQQHGAHFSTGPGADGTGFVAGLELAAA